MTGIARRWHDAEIRDREGAVLATTRANAWRLSQARPSPGGQVYDYSGACNLDADDALVGQQNRLLRIGAEEWRVADAQPYRTLGYIGLSLIQVRADG